MTKRILVALDPDGDTPVATWYAIDIARRHGAVVSSLAVVDTLHIDAEVGPGGAIGGTVYADRIRLQKRSEARSLAHALTDAFVHRLEAAGLQHGDRIEEGSPVQHILEAMKVHDLLVLGRTSRFHYEEPEEETRTLARIVKRAVGPTLVVDEVTRRVERVLIACDGSVPAAHAMQRFAQLHPFGKDVWVQLLHVRKDGHRRAMDTADRLLHANAAYLRAHGFSRVMEMSREAGTPGEEILQHARETHADLIVAGTHAVSAARRMVFGSTTHHLVQHGEVALFLSA